MKLLAIDPGNTESAYVLVDEHCRPLRFAKLPNDRILTVLEAGTPPDKVVIEMVASYGMSVGAEVFETCVWIGRFQQLLAWRIGIEHIDLVKRLPVKTHLCHDSKAKDSNIRQALVDRFAHGQKNHGKGTTKAPGWFHGFSADIWQAYALAVYAVDIETKGAS